MPDVHRLSGPPRVLSELRCGVGCKEGNEHDAKRMPQVEREPKFLASNAATEVSCNHDYRKNCEQAGKKR